MKNINKSNIMGLIGMDVINIKNEEVGTVVGDFNGKYIVNVDGEEKFYSESTLIKNWKIVEEETEEISEAVLTTEETEEEIINENDEVIEEETEDIIDEENTEDEDISALLAGETPEEDVEAEGEDITAMDDSLDDVDGLGYDDNEYVSLDDETEDEDEDEDEV